MPGVKSCFPTGRNSAMKLDVRKRKDIYATYREILGQPKLPRKEIDRMRKYTRLLVETMVEHFWGRKIY